jgi:hypothetical protein
MTPILPNINAAKADKSIPSNTIEENNETRLLKSPIPYLLWGSSFSFASWRLEKALKTEYQRVLDLETKCSQQFQTALKNYNNALKKEQRAANQYNKAFPPKGIMAIDKKQFDRDIQVVKQQINWRLLPGALLTLDKKELATYQQLKRLGQKAQGSSQHSFDSPPPTRDDYQQALKTRVKQLRKMQHTLKLNHNSASPQLIQALAVIEKTQAAKLRDIKQATTAAKKALKDSQAAKQAFMSTTVANATIAVPVYKKHTSIKKWYPLKRNIARGLKFTGGLVALGSIGVKVYNAFQTPVYIIKPKEGWTPDCLDCSTT